MNDLKFTTASDYMNTGTKFDDLMYRAGLTAQGCWDEMDDYDRKAIEKFAELIVRECVDKIETYRIPVGNSAAGEIACGMTYDSLKEIRDEIKEHFGVEL
jgi:hypothetical protein